jgi:hypothetical protein
MTAITIPGGKININSSGAVAGSSALTEIGSESGRI